MVETITKAEIIELCNTVITSRVPDRLFKTLEGNKELINEHLASDLSFKREFETKIIQLSNISSLFYNFIASCEFLPDIRPCSMANFINSLYLLVKKPGRNNKIFIKLLTKVSIIWFMTGFHIAAMDNVNKQQYEVEIKQDYYMIKSEISTVMYQELAEVHGTTEIQNQIEYIDNNLGLIKGLSGYHRDNKNCEHIGNHETDDLKEIINLIKNLPFTNYRLFIREKSDLEKYMVILKRMKGQSKCVMGHSKFSIIII